MRKLSSLLIGLLFISCQPVLRTFLGIKDVKAEMKNSERLEYYEPFINGNTANLRVMTLKDTIALKHAFKTFKDFPQVFAKNINTNVIYRITCYDDTSGQIEDLNSGTADYLVKVSDSAFTAVSNIFEDDSKIVYSNSTVKDANVQWDVFIISGTFLGNKLRNRTLPVANLRNTRRIEILDLSVDIPE